jgi:DNA-binding NarL/FixJ family response regulator
VRLPGLNGIEATRLISKQFPNIKILILSAYDDDAYVFPLFDAGASGYLLKTSSGSELSEAIKLVNSGQTALSPRISTKIINHLGGRQAYRKNNMPEGLSHREIDVLNMAAQGHPNKIIAADLGISPQTVQVHMRNIFGKLGVSNRSEAIAHAIKFGWITLESIDE